MTPDYDDTDNFADADEFIDCFNRGCEFCFNYGGKSYAISPAPGDDRFCFGEAYKEKTIIWYDTAEAMLNHPMGGGKRLRDILQEMVVTDRTVY